MQQSSVKVPKHEIF
jgi:hypothetical protein